MNLYEKVFIFLAVAFALQSCKNEKQKSTENKNTENQKTEQSNTPVNQSPENTEGKKNPSDFVPKGYVINKYEGGISAEGWDEIRGDLNKDGLEDAVLIIKGTDKSKIIQDEDRGTLDRNRRGIIVL